MQHKLCFILGAILLTISSTWSTETDYRLDPIATRALSILTHGIEGSLNERHRTPQELHSLTKQYVDAQLLEFKKQLGPRYDFPRLQQHLLKIILVQKHGSSKTWSFTAPYYIQKGYGLDYLVQLFETKEGVDPSVKFQILKDAIYRGEDRSKLTSYILGMIQKKELQPMEICLALVFLQYNLLTESHWLSIVEGVFSMSPSLKTLKQEKSDQEFRALMLKGIETSHLILKLYQDMERFERQSAPSVGHVRTLQYLKDYQIMLHYPAVCQEIRYVFQKTKRSFSIDMSLIQHLSPHFPEEEEIRDFLMMRWVDQTTQRASSLGMEQVGVLINQARSDQKPKLAEQLCLRAHRVLKALPVKNPLISIVSSAEPSGDGINPETFDYYGGKGIQYPQLSLLVPELQKRGYEVEVLNWENPDIQWENRPFLFVGTMWGYTRKQQEFDAWLELMNSLSIPLINSLEFVTWNIRKTYLLELQEAGIPVIPTLIIPEDSPRRAEEIFEAAEKAFGTRDIIFKGVEDAGGSGYLHDHRLDIVQCHLEILKERNHGAVVQPFWSEVSQKGELSYVFFGHALSHSYLKIPKAGSELVQLFHGGMSCHMSKKDLSDESEAFFQKLKEFRPDLKLTREDLIYAHGCIFDVFYALTTFFSQRKISMPPVVRVDCIIKNNQLYIMEIEGIPYLEIGGAQDHDPTKKVVEWYADEVIRQHSVYTMKTRYKI